MKANSHRRRIGRESEELNQRFCEARTSFVADLLDDIRLVLHI